MSNSGVNRVSQVEVLARPGERLLPSDPTYLESLTIGPRPRLSPQDRRVGAGSKGPSRGM